MERRNSPRVDSPLMVEVSSDERAARLGFLCNLSQQGCALFSRAGFSVGDEVELSLQLQEGAHTRLKGNVVRRQPVDSEVWRFLFAVALDNSDASPALTLMEGQAAGLFGNEDARLDHSERGDL
ncbi:MAG: PilZ domain-containing protein [Myxococcota bacterium]